MSLDFYRISNSYIQTLQYFVTLVRNDVVYKLKDELVAGKYTGRLKGRL